MVLGYNLEGFQPIKIYNFFIEHRYCHRSICYLQGIDGKISDIAGCRVIVPAAMRSPVIVPAAICVLVIVFAAMSPATIVFAAMKFDVTELA